MLNSLWGEMRPAKTITDTDIQNTFSLLIAQGVDLRSVTLENWGRYGPSLFEHQVQQMVLMCWFAQNVKSEITRLGQLAFRHVVIYY